MDVHAVPGRRRSAALLAVALCAVLPAPAALAQAFHVVPEAGRTMSEAEWQAMKARAVPAERLFDPAARRPLAAPVFSTAPPELVPGNPGTAPNLAERGGFDLPAGEEGTEPENYGKDGLDHIFHFNDYLQVPRPVRYYPWRAVGKIYFRDASGNDRWCTGALISRSIIVTAGQCVHEGGTGRAGWNQTTVFVPAADGAREPYGRCNGNYLITTDQWFYGPEPFDGHDVGIIGCGKRLGTRREIGVVTGWLGHCASGCLLRYWFLTQVGYPENYYDGGYMTTSQHLANGYDDLVYYLYGTGMRGGSTGGPQIANIGVVDDTSTDLGQFILRNIVFAVTSYIGPEQEWKLGGASALSGPGDSNGWKFMFNWVCGMVRGAHGSRSCDLL